MCNSVCAYSCDGVTVAGNEGEKSGITRRRFTQMNADQKSRAANHTNEHESDKLKRLVDNITSKSKHKVPPSYSPLVNVRAQQPSDDEL